MFFQLTANAASLTVTTRRGKTYLFERNKPLAVDIADREELGKRPELEECPEAGIKGRRAAGPKPKSLTTFNGPAAQPPPKPRPHEPNPKELGEALSSAAPSKGKKSEDEDEDIEPDDK